MVEELTKMTMKLFEIKLCWTVFKVREYILDELINIARPGSI
jgi:hypothetical protein